MQIKALLFDLGRVVIDVDFARVVAAWARAAQRNPTDLALGFNTKVRSTDWYGRHERGEISDAVFFREVANALSLDLDERAMRAGWDDIFVGEMPGIDAVLRRWAPRTPVYALSNTNPSHHAVFALRFADVLAHFRKLYLSHEIGLRKPEPAIYRAVADDLALQPGEILFFDDSAENVAAATAVGMRGVMVQNVDDVVRALE